MVLHSSSENKEETFLPSIADNNGSKGKHNAKRGGKKKGSRNKKQKDAFVRFPELATDNGLTKNSAKTFARKSSSPKVTFQSQEMLKKSQSEAEKFTTHERRRGNLHLPSLASTSESVTSKPTEIWSIALGLRDSYEIPRGVFNKLTDDILKIDRQMREEAKLQEIREKRMISLEWRDSTEAGLSSSGRTFGRTSLPRFSYFPSLQTKSTGDRSEYMRPHWAKDNISERMIRQEREIERKQREFKHRHSLSKYKGLK